MRLGLTLTIICAFCLLLLRPIPAHQKGVAGVRPFTWVVPHTDFGGFSALHVSDDGARLLALTDRGMAFAADLTRTDQQISQATVTSFIRLSDGSGTPLEAENTDVEGLAVGPDDKIFISFEAIQRIRRYDTISAAGEMLPAPNAFDRYFGNAGLEALAIDADGRLYTLPEGPHAQPGRFTVWRWDGALWTSPFSIRHRNGFRAVGAEIGPDGAFYLLERRVTFLGFQSRLRRWRLTDTGADGEETLMVTKPGAFQNLEGLSIRSGAKGELILTMISDDNFRWPLYTQLVEVTAKEMLAP